tara:strand:+ start:3399 stop:3569 length:171 start_codon:yes stop_codon:yes gene_type:complete
MTPHINPKKHLQLFIKNRKISEVGDIDTPLDIPIITLDQRGQGLRPAESCPSIERC